MDGIFAMFAESCGLDEGFNYESNRTMYSEAELAEEMEHLEEIEDVEVSDDLMEACFESMLIDEQNYNNIMNAVAYSEMKAYVEGGSLESLNEEGRLKSFFDMIKKWIDRAWEKIKSIFNKAISFIEGLVRSDKAFLSKYEKEIKKAKPSDVEYKGHKYDVEALKMPYYKAMLVAFFSVSDKYVNYGSFASEDPAMDSNKATNKSTEKVCDQFRGMVLGNKFGSLTADQYKTELKKLIGADSGKESLTFSSAEVLDELRNGKSTKMALKSGYNMAKSLFAGFRKYFNGLEKSAKTAADVQGKKAKKTNYSLASSLAKCASTTCSVTQRIQINALNTYHRQCRAMAAIAVRSVKHEGADMFDDEDNGDRFAFIV